MRTPFRATTPAPRYGDLQPSRQAAADRSPARHSSLSSPASPGQQSEDTPIAYETDVAPPSREPRTTPSELPDDRTEAAPAAASASASARRPVAEHTYLDRHTTVEGTLRSAKDLRIEGRVEGEIICDGKLTIAEGAVVQARIEAAEVLISGNVQGDVHSHGGLKLLPTAVIRGSSTAARITIEDGATYEGELHMTTDVPRTDDIAETPLSGVLANRERLAAAPSQAEPARTGANGNASRSGNGARASV